VKAQDPQEVLDGVAARIAELRAAANLTQAQIAERLGMTLTNYQRIEHGLNITIKTLARIAFAVGVAPVELLVPTAVERKRRGRPRKRLK
jgi:transcriptional regulator with XRE-family HTH domain